MRPIPKLVIAPIVAALVLPASPAQAQILGPAVGAAAAIIDAAAQGLAQSRKVKKHKLRNREDLHLDDSEARRNFKRMQKRQAKLLNGGDNGPRRVRTISPDSRRY